MSTRLRLGWVPDLNGRPLVHGLDGDDRLEGFAGPPSLLAQMLLAGELDAALAPSVVLLARPDLVPLSDAGVACEGPVYSVRMYHRKPLGEVKTLAVDASSQTSRTLARLYCERRYGVRPALLPLQQAVPPAADADAFVLIGDRALRGPSDLPWVDLGAAWFELSGLPMVFARWLARNDLRALWLADVLAQARDRGLDQRASLAEAGAKEGLGSRQRLREYLEKNLRYRLGPREERGLQRFLDEARRLGPEA